MLRIFIVSGYVYSRFAAKGSSEKYEFQPILSSEKFDFGDRIGSEK